MKIKTQKITQRQGNRIFILETFSAAAMFLPQIALQGAYGCGLVAVITACILAGVYLLVTAKVAGGISVERVLKKYPWVTWIYYIRFLINAGFFYMCIVSLARQYLMPGRSGYLIGLPLVFLAYQMNRGGLRERGRVMEGIFWFVLAPVLFVLLLSVGNLSFDQLVVDGFQWKMFGRGSFLLLALLNPIELVWFYRGDMEHGDMKLRSILGLTILFTGIFVVTVGSLGRDLTLFDRNPVMSMAQGAAMPGGLMARLDIFLIAFWIVGVFCVFSGYLFYANESVKHAFPKARLVGVILSYGGIFLLTRQLIECQEWFHKYFDMFLYGNLAVGLVLPVILFYLEKEKGHERV